MNPAVGVLGLGLAGLLCGTATLPDRQDPPQGKPAQDKATQDKPTQDKPAGGGPTPATRPPQDPQNPTAEEPAPIPSNKFLDGWMAELLHGDQRQARREYLEAMPDAGLPDHQSTLAILRLWESTWFRSDSLRYQRMLEDRGLYYREMSQWNFAEFERKSVEFARALAEDDDARLAELRRSVADYVAANPAFRSRRQLVRNALADLRRPADPDPELEELKRQLDQARSRGDRAMEFRLRRRIQGRTRQGQENFRQLIGRLQLIGKRWAQMTRLHLEGRHRRAEAFESLMGTRDRFARSGSIQPRAFHQARIAQWDPPTRMARLTSVVGRLTDRYPMTSPSLLDQERDVLTALRRKVVELQTAGRVEEALQLVARTPYRNILLLGRRTR